MEWMVFRGQFLPLMIIRRYLKLTFNYCNRYNLIDENIEFLKEMELPFKIEFLPTIFPTPEKLILNITEKENV